jgi:hypothetical protein
MTPNTLEAQGLINRNEYNKTAALTHSASPDAQKKIAGITLSCYFYAVIDHSFNPVCLLNLCHAA